ncbi:hypothetical protein K7W03_20500 [Sphingobium sp. PNB]|uniref:hypothetical protein n=1 Tax=Sphingobium sp. PNB TaxID=863934 RepID=UPI001CA455A7|nr:hypothetical protein [Sphingobium sp. PNB]MCB4861976.1 hypothetical protein [Sphingobium sp. PNB]
MAITIPTLPKYLSTDITLRTSATDQTPYLGGPTQRIARLGDRWVYKVVCQDMRADQAGLILAALNGGLSDKVVCEVRQNGVDLSAYSNGTVVGAASGRTLNHSGGGGTKFVGQYFSLVKNGVRYLHQITAVAGTVLTFAPMLKVTVSGGEVLEFGSPKIEGFLDGKEQTYTVGFLGNVTLGFSIVEGQ